MESGKGKKDGFSMFSDDELSELGGLEKHDDHVVVTCGCSSKKFGDAVGKLRVFASGELLVTCECTPGCPEDKLTPAAFEKHSGREGAIKWKNYVWVFINGEKVPLFKTPLLRYYEKSLGGKWSHKKTLNVHRDEFIRCTSCKKQRRFRLKTKEECRQHHDAMQKSNWTCAEHPDKISCNDDEERSTRRVLRGCSRHPTCKGCTICVCFGCNMCRYADCSCQTCVDFTKNAQT